MKNMNETPEIQEMKEPINLTHENFLRRISQASSFEGVNMVKKILEGKINLENITPNDGQRIRETRKSFSAFQAWCITVAQVPRLRELVKQGLLSPEEAVASLRAFENHFFRSSSDGGKDWGPNYATTRAIPDAVKKEALQFKTWPEEIIRLVETVAYNPIALFT